MAAQIPFSLAGQLVSLLGSPALEEIKLAYGAKKELKKLKARLTSINAILRHADEQHQKKKPGVEEWIRRLKEVLYDADDLLDEVATEGLRQRVDTRGRIAREVCDFFSSSNQIVFRVKMGHKIKEVREKLDEVVKDMSQFNFLSERVVIDLGVVSNRRETYSEVLKDEIIGREKDEKEIIKLLQQPGDQNQKNVSMVAIVGIGALGKTTLAQKVYNDESVKQYFSERMWVYVSDDFNVKTIAKKILCSTKDEDGDVTLQQLQTLLREKLEGRRYLLVLDDVWNEDEERWDSLKTLLFYGARGSKILVTTRSKKVASVMGVDSKIDSLYQLEGLSDKESCILFEQKAFRGRDETPSSARLLLVVGKDLVIKRCKGVPLAIKTLASAVRSYPNEAYWSSMKENEMWSLLGGEDDGSGILPVLKLSYYNLPNHLKQCFAYCSIYPKGTIIRKELLVKLWLAHGYVESSIGDKGLEEIGDMYFDELLSMSFFQEETKDDVGNIETVKMHDLIHDLTQFVSRSDYLILPFDKEKKAFERVNHVALVDDRREVNWNEIISILKSICEEKASLRTSILFGLVEGGEEIKSNIRDSIFSNLKCVRVLVLDARNTKLPRSFAKLMHLRYLCLSSFEFKKLPGTICNLLNLQTLILVSCYNLEELPKDLGKLVCLRHLVIDGCRNLQCMPLGFGKLTSLRELSTIYVTEESRWYVLNELSDLDLLRGRLCLEGLKNVKDVELEAKQVSLKRKKYLQSLTFDWSLDSYLQYRQRDDQTLIKKDELLLDYLEPHENLKDLTVTGYPARRFSGWLSCITNLVRLVITECYNCRHLPPLDQLHSLMHLELNRMGLEYVELSSEASSSSSMTMANRFFPSLEELIIYSCEYFRGWWRRSINDNDDDADVDVGLQPCNWFPRLTRLSIFRCPKLSSMPLFPTLEKELSLYLTSAKPLQQTMEMKINAKTNTASSSSSSTCLLSSLPLHKLKRLELKSLDDLQSVTLPEERVRGLTSLKDLVIHDCPKLTSLPDWVRHLPCLQRLQITMCEEMSKRCKKDEGPDWWKIQHIPNFST